MIWLSVSTLKSHVELSLLLVETGSCPLPRATAVFCCWQFCRDGDGSALRLIIHVNWFTGFFSMDGDHRCERDGWAVISLRSTCHGRGDGTLSFMLHCACVRLRGAKCIRVSALCTAMRSLMLIKIPGQHFAITIMTWGRPIMTASLRPVSVKR